MQSQALGQACQAVTQVCLMAKITYYYKSISTCIVIKASQFPVHFLDHFLGAFLLHNVIGSHPKPTCLLTPLSTCISKLHCNFQWLLSILCPFALMKVISAI